jgi:hypothetical protein
VSPARRAGAAAVAGGLAWLALVPASLLYRSGELSFEGYYRGVAVPLVLLALAWGLLWPVWRPQDLRARFGYGLTLAGLALAATGTALEFWAGWAAGEESARRPGAPDEVGWWGSDVGSALFLFGVMALFAGGPTAAVALRGALPFWALALIALVGFGVLSATLLDDSSPVATVPIFGAFGLGWTALGILLRRSHTPAGGRGSAPLRAR